MAKRRTTPDLNLQPELPKVLATDFNLFYKPQEEPETAGLQEFTKSLDAFVNQGLTKKVLADEKQEKNLNIDEARKLKEENKLSFKDAVEKGIIDKNSNPYLIEAYKNLDLQEKARKFKNDLYLKYQELDVGENPNSGAFTEFYNSQLEKFFKDNQLGLFSATELNDSFFTETDKVRNGLENIHVQSQLEKVGKRFKKGFTDSILGILENGKTDDSENRFQNMGDAINKLLQNHIDVRNPTDLRDYVLEGVEEFIKNTRDFDYADDVLDNLMKFVESGTAPFENIGAVKNKIDGLRDILDDERKDFENDQTDKYENNIKKGKIEIRKSLAEKFKEDDFSFYEYRKSEEFLSLAPEIQEEAKSYYNNFTGNTFSSSSSIEVLTQLNKLLQLPTTDEAEAFLEENKDLLSKADYFNYKDTKIPNAFFNGNDPLLKSPRFKDFMAIAEKSILNSPTAEYNIGDSFNRLAEYKDDALEWLQENPLSKYNGSKLARKQAFEKYLKDTAKNFNLFTNEVEYKG